MAAMNPILYLGIEGVLFRDRIHCHSSHRAARPTSFLEPLPLLEPLVTVVARHDELCIVLNSWFVADYGFRQVLHILPQRIAEKTIGATMHGNRLHHRPIAYQSRAEMLREDVHKRTPSQITIVDASHSAIPSEYNDRAIWVETTNMNFAPRFEAILSRLLETSHPGYR
ncbi:conserved hypothetical protein (plasmid) [Paraburkholderia phymatum STM815]|uniref:Uncharacterized protein n=2 Tax=Paraburkholderia phymatum TaxID=148447 RepID=B2JTR7_PARP8|nr:conserved hypothetical protein [Paraburkholderia phymatum STM815]